MLRVVAIGLFVTGCTSIDIEPCLALDGSCSPPPYITGPSLADAEISQGVAVDGLYKGSIDGEPVEFIGALEPSEDQARLGVRAFPLEAVTLVPFEMPFLDRDYPFAVAANAPVDLVIQLSGANRARVVDVALEVELAGAERRAWDLYRVAAPGDIALDVIAAQRAWEHTVPVATAIDDIVPLPEVFGGDLDAMPAVTDITVCFAAMTGDAHVAGLAWEITGDGIVEPPDATSATGGCAVIARPYEGMTLTVRTGGRERTFTVHMATPPLFPRPAVQGST